MKEHGGPHRILVRAAAGMALAQAPLLILCFWDGPGLAKAGLLLGAASLEGLVGWWAWKKTKLRWTALQRGYETAVALAARAAETQRSDAAARGNEARDVERSIGVFRADIMRRLDSVGRSAEAFHKTAEDLSRAALRITSETTAVSVSAEEADRTLQCMVASSAEFFETMARIGAHAARSADMGVEAFRRTEATETTIGELNGTSDKIGDMTEIVAAIARQTNLLALNATIEAARAGEHGRGFAVVAAEVKSLATETGRAVATIAEMASAIHGSTERTGAAINAIATAIEGLNAASAAIAAAVEERVQAAASMTGSVGRAASNVGFVSAAIGKIEAAVDEAMQGAGFLRMAAGEVAEQAAAIRGEVERYTSAA